jgi:hypothetical protein
LSSGKAVEGDMFQGAAKRSLGVQGGLGWQDAINFYFPQGHLYTTTDLANAAKPEPQIFIYLLYGSFFGDRNMTNDFLRATLATPTMACWRSGRAATGVSKRWR